MNIEERKADFMRRFKASRERKAEYIAQMEKRMRDDYRRRAGGSVTYRVNDKYFSLIKKI